MLGDRLAFGLVLDAVKSGDIRTSDEIFLLRAGDQQCFEVVAGHQLIEQSVQLVDDVLIEHIDRLAGHIKREHADAIIHREGERRGRRLFLR